MADRFFDGAALYRALDEQRRVVGISWRQLCQQAGLVSPAHTRRLRDGHGLNADTFLRLLAWLDEKDVTPYVRVWRGPS